VINIENWTLHKRILKYKTIPNHTLQGLYVLEYNHHINIPIKLLLKHLKKFNRERNLAKSSIKYVISKIEFLQNSKIF
jgi:hypothetical protein